MATAPGLKPPTSFRRDEPKIYPKPEAVSPGKWDISPMAPFGDVPRVSNQDRKAVVPLDPSTRSRAVRAHEMGHAKWSPKTYPKGYNPMSILAAEDARINLASRTIYKPLPDGSNLMDHLYSGDEFTSKCTPEALATAGLFQSACLATASLGTNLEAPTREAIEALRNSENPADRSRGRALKQALAYATKQLSFDRARRAPARFARTKDVAKYLYKLQLIEDEEKKKLAEEEARKRGGSPDGIKPGETKGGSAKDERRDDLDEMLAHVADREVKFEEKIGTGKRRRRGDTPSGRHIPWGDMTIKTVPLKKSFKARTAMKPRPFEEGHAFAHPERLYIDARVFSRLLPNAGGTVLIDHSGSMNLSAEQVKQIIDEAPAATVATYSGDSTTGSLKVVAAKGRMAEGKDLTDRPAGGGNIVDGPALDWLAKQRGPRIWVSDGQVTGQHDQMSIPLTRYAIRLCLKHRIYRVDNPKDAARMLATRL